MRLYKRKSDGTGAWWFSFSHRGKSVRKTTGTEDKQAAQEYADRYRGALWRVARLDERPEVMWDVAASDWLDANQGLRALSDRKDHLRWAQPYLTGMPLTAIDRPLLIELRKKKASDGVSGATVNRYLASISAVLGHAVERGWLTAKPLVPKLPEAKKRIKWATQAQATKLVAALPQHLGAMAAFSLATGLRRSNVTHLEWSEVNLVRKIAWVHPDKAKGGRPLAVPLNEEALKLLRGQRGQHKQWVFPYRGKPITRQGDNGWRDACKAAGLKDFRWHDLRHTWASWHVQNGTPLAVLQELGGWRSPSMVQRYAHLGPSHLAAYAANAGVKHVQNRVHEPKSGRGQKAGLYREKEGWQSGLMHRT
jgi:integrase